MTNAIYANFARDAITASLAIPQNPNPSFLTPFYRVSPIAHLLRMQTRSGTGSVRTYPIKPLNPLRQIHQIPSNKRIIPLIPSINICLWKYRKQPRIEPGGYFQKELRDCLFHQRSVSVEYPGYCCSGRRLKKQRSALRSQGVFWRFLLGSPLGALRRYLINLYYAALV